LRYRAEKHPDTQTNGVKKNSTPATVFGVDNKHYLVTEINQLRFVVHVPAYCLNALWAARLKAELSRILGRQMVSWYRVIGSTEAYSIVSLIEVI